MSSRASASEASLGRALVCGVGLCRRHAHGLFDALMLTQLLDAIALVLLVREVSVVTTRVLGSDGRLPAAHTLVWPAVLLGVAAAVIGLCAAAQPALQTVLGERLSAATTQELLTAAGGLELADFDRPEVLDRLKRVEFGAFIRPAQLAAGLGITLSGLVGALALAVAVVTLAPWLALVAVVAAAPLWWVAQRDGAQAYRTVRGLTRLERRRMYLAGLLTRREHAAEVRCFDLAPTIVRRYSALSEQRRREVTATARDRMVRQLGARLVGGALLLVGLLVLAWLVHRGSASLAAAVAAAAAGVALRTRLADAASGLRQMQEAAEFLVDHAALVSSVPDRPTVVDGGDPLTEVELRGVTFTYPGRTTPALRGVDLTLRAGEITALVGANGSGKSTLAAVAAGLLAPSSGRVLFNGSLNADAWRTQFAVLRQDAGRYQESLRDNVAFGATHREVSDDEVRSMLDAAGASSLLDALGDDLGTLLGAEVDGGRELSGGQWQRVALARVLCRGGSVLILDEPTAPLDPLAERDLVARLRRSFADRAVLLITHRMAAARQADQVVVLDGGVIVQRGEPGVLVRQSGQFAELCAAEDAVWRSDPVTV
ncbi:MAG: ATP-binding cassette domain-containing protein [Jatrophihabitans sp.]|uniref:ATP-binding cassette domain-containing protein n=1 Tax=Jatrophihabitans sp. TaxID=1932789 RepID=UPI003F7DD216